MVKKTRPQSKRFLPVTTTSANVFQLLLQNVVDFLSIYEAYNHLSRYEVETYQ